MNVLPFPKYRKWTIAEVPVGQVVRLGGGDFRYLILAADDEGVHLLGDHYKLQVMLDEFTMEDGSPCGVATA